MKIFSSFLLNVKEYILYNKRFQNCLLFIAKICYQLDNEFCRIKLPFCKCGNNANKIEHHDRCCYYSKNITISERCIDSKSRSIIFSILYYGILLSYITKVSLCSISNVHLYAYPLLKLESDITFIQKTD